MNLSTALARLDDAALDNFMRSTQAHITAIAVHGTVPRDLRDQLDAAIRERNVRHCRARPATMRDIVNAQLAAFVQAH